MRFKPQRGKFTQIRGLQRLSASRRVSNPNGVNLHLKLQRLICPRYRFKPQRGKFTQISIRYAPSKSKCFKPQRGKFTPGLRKKLAGF